MRCVLWLLASAISMSGAPVAGCSTGSLADLLALGSGGCSVGALAFSDFALAPGIPSATAIDSAAVQVTPGGTFYSPSLLFTVSSSADSGDLQQLFLSFRTIGPAIGASIQLNAPSVTGDGAVTGILDVCAGGLFSGIAPIGCSGTPANAIAFQITGDQELLAGTSFALSGQTDVFVDLTVDAGPSGTASLASASVTFSAVPEVATWVVVPIALIILVISRRFHAA